ncbi:stage V sporulation protein AEB [Brevibacillus sp. SKDU10]|uniref:stage V sporulation protein AE n=1 Tax=Brevibacillus sp. SKDU10 TaxID=1247872 RepID=UPI0007C8A24B|nr:stage V sporulation protein AE [Brevibacillus sp. SKDU10]OAJ75046.1 stage V sporulation protein AEB [Brevibacillus sp. SKDU10]
MEYLIAFIIGGLICVVGQIMLDVAKITPAHVMVTLVVSGVVLDFIGIYDGFIKFAGAGATVPIISFGHSLYHGALQELNQTGAIGVASGMFEVPAAGITAAIAFSFLASLVFKPKG